LLSLTSGGRKNKRTKLDDRRSTLCHVKAGGHKSITSRIPHYWRNATKLFGDLFPSSTPGFLSLTSAGRKNKRTELDDRRLTLCHAIFLFWEGGVKSITSRISHYWRNATKFPSSTTGFLSLTSGGRKNKKT